VLPLLLLECSWHTIQMVSSTNRSSVDTTSRMLFMPAMPMRDALTWPDSCAALRWGVKWLRSVEMGETHKPSARGMLVLSWGQLRRHLPAVLAVAALSDGVMFLLHRLSHRLTNTGAAPLTNKMHDVARVHCSQQL